jgi:UDP-N-acetylglucosamine 4,6-dehydratase
MEILNKKTVLISGGTASFGNIFIETSLKTYGKIKNIIIFSVMI